MLIFLILAFIKANIIKFSTYWFGVHMVCLSYVHKWYLSRVISGYILVSEFSYTVAFFVARKPPIAENKYPHSVIL